MSMKFWTTIICSFLFLQIGFTQKKKKVDVRELDLIRGQYHQRNTIGPFTGIAEEKHSNGKKKSSIPIKDGRVNGKAREWAKDGTKIYEAVYVNGVQNGPEWQWYATGDKKVEVNYVNGQPDGSFTEWYRSGKKKSMGQFRNGKEEGKHQWWFSTGQLDQEATYRNGLTEGTVKNWFPSGQLRLESQYTAGEKSGTTRKWFANGQLKSEESYVNDEPDGESRYWDKKGVLRAVKVYKQGKLLQERLYRSGSINIGNGYLQVYNELESHFQVPVTGTTVRVVDNKIITYVVDGQLLQLYNVSVEDFLDTTRTANSDRELLERYLAFEADQMQFAEPEFKFDIKKEERQRADDRLMLHWYFASPSAQVEEQTDYTVQEEHYISMVCGNQILSLYCPINKLDDPKLVQEMLWRIASATEIKDTPIDLNLIISDIKKN